MTAPWERQNAAPRGEEQGDVGANDGGADNTVPYNPNHPFVAAEVPSNFKKVLRRKAKTVPRTQAKAVPRTQAKALPRTQAKAVPRTQVKGNTTKRAQRGTKTRAAQLSAPVAATFPVPTTKRVPATTTTGLTNIQPVTAENLARLGAQLGPLGAPPVRFSVPQLPLPPLPAPSYPAATFFPFAAPVPSQQAGDPYTESSMVRFNDFMGAELATFDQPAPSASQPAPTPTLPPYLGEEYPVDDNVIGTRDEDYDEHGNPKWHY
ncbi:hypothetical protein C8A00DRAFT_31165 [Chaetomidium leptoderma]|uniref:Uncharacterized protein n=1 Tax=Chaetomidium leptoderma TaxID=669021 RepID=A0AAN6VTK5_9PEZI|nr:hypothetical protein C8A00DRAFT_31165 [Chaetomidium leptoderma]